MTVDSYSVTPAPKILIIDDEEVVLDSCLQILEGGEFRLATAPDGTLGLRLLPEFKPDLVFVDLKMPGLSGFDVLERIHAFDPTIVAVVITGYATVNSAVEAMKKGAYDFLPKPFTPDELCLITHRALEKRSLVLEAMALRREKEMLREHFAAIVSHELKSPLGAVQQNLFALLGELSTQLSADQKARSERMKSRLADLLRLIDTWLRVISVDVAKIREHFEPISITSCLSIAIENVQPQAARKDVEIVTRSGDTLSFVAGHAGSLIEALVNILGNAVKYSRPGSQVVVKAEETGEHLLVSVADNGVGIAPEDLPFLFQDFFRGASGPTSERGCGLGLSVSRRLIEAHGGSIGVESVLGKGSTFTIRLPVLKTDSHGSPGARTARLAGAHAEA